MCAYRAAITVESIAHGVEQSATAGLREPIADCKQGASPGATEEVPVEVEEEVPTPWTPIQREEVPPCLFLPPPVSTCIAR